jgi:hypothetical protein
MLSEYSPSLAGGSGAQARAFSAGRSTSTLKHVAASPCRIATRSSNASCPRNFYDDQCDCSDALLAIAFGLLPGLSGRMGGQSHPDALVRLLT